MQQDTGTVVAFKPEHLHQENTFLLDDYFSYFSILGNTFPPCDTLDSVVQSAQSPYKYPTSNLAMLKYSTSNSTMLKNNIGNSNST